MGTNYQHEIGYETLQKDFKRYQKETPKGVSLQNKRNQTIVLKFKINGKPKSKGCNCSFTLDGMVDALFKARKVADALKTIKSETEFWQWYESEILEKNVVKNDLLTFSEAIAVVENDFWSRPDRRKRKRSKSNPSDRSSWNDTYNRFYKYLPTENKVNLSDITKVINRYSKGARSYKYVVTVMKKLARMIKRKDIENSLNELTIVQTEFLKLQSITLDEFLIWYDKMSGKTSTIHPNVNLDVRKAWLWVFSMQVVYGLRIHEVFAILNIDRPYKTEDGATIPSLSDVANSSNLIVIGKETSIGTTTKTLDRIARPNIPPKHPDLIERLEIKKPLLPTNKPKGSNPNTIRKFYANKAKKMLDKWNAPFTQTHALRHLANHNGIQAGIPLEVRAQSFGHTPAMNDSTYKKRKRTQTTIDLLLNSNTQAIDFVNALSEAKNIVKEQPQAKTAIAALIARIYSKNIDDIVKIL